MNMPFKPGQNVLIIDDDPVICAVASSFFKKRGAETIRVANDGIEAVEIIRAHGGEIDCALCDLNMPKMDGLQLLRHMKDHNFTGALAILSGEDRVLLGLAENLAKQLNLNIMGALSKPLNYAQLDKLLASASQKKTLLSQLDAAQVTVEELHTAIISGHIEAHYQPQVNVLTCKLEGAEALARWNHPERGIIMPGEFIPLAEESGLIKPLTKVMFSHAVRDYAQLKRLNRHFTMSVNLSADLLSDHQLPGWICGQVDDAGFDRGKFMLEITESQILKQDAASLENIARLSMMGFKFSIDDFGMAYSNIEHLMIFPFSEIKFDYNFISKIVTDERARAGVEAGVTMARKQNLITVAEGVETSAEHRLVAEMGIDVMQGFMIAKAMPAAAFHDWFLGRPSVCAQGQPLRKAAPHGF